jgi:hypothetical protein
MTNQTNQSAAPPASQEQADDKHEQELMDALKERDTYHEWADELANAIARHTGYEIGEHSSDNNPWRMALNALECHQRVSQEQISDSEILSLAHRKAWRYKYSSDPAHSSTYTFNDMLMVEFVRYLLGMRQPAIVGGAQQPSEQWETSPTDGEQWETSPMDGETWETSPMQQPSGGGV